MTTPRSEHISWKFWATTCVTRLFHDLSLPKRPEKDSCCLFHYGCKSALVNIDLVWELQAPAHRLLCNLNRRESRGEGWVGRESSEEGGAPFLSYTYPHGFIKFKIVISRINRLRNRPRSPTSVITTSHRERLQYQI